MAEVSWATAGEYDWVVPAGVTEVVIQAWGAFKRPILYGWVNPDGPLGPYLSGWPGVQTTPMAVTPGETLTIRVGGSPTGGGTGGFNGGGSASRVDAAGHGASEVRRDDDLLIVAGGQGGGAGWLQDGEIGGFSDNTNGPTYVTSSPGPTDPPRVAPGAPPAPGLLPSNGYDYQVGGESAGADAVSYSYVRFGVTYTAVGGAGGGGYGGGYGGYAGTADFIVYPPYYAYGAGGGSWVDAAWRPSDPREFIVYRDFPQPDLPYEPDMDPFEGLVTIAYTPAPKTYSPRWRLRRVSWGHHAAW